MTSLYLEKYINKPITIEEKMHLPELIDKACHGINLTNKPPNENDIAENNINNVPFLLFTIDKILT